MIDPSHYASQEVAKKLQEAGILFPLKQGDAVFVSKEGSNEWHLTKYKEIEWYQKYYHVPPCWIILKTPSLSEIMDELPGYAVFQIDKKWICGKVDIFNDYYMITDLNIESTEAETAPDAAASMLLERRGEK